MKKCYKCKRVILGHEEVFPYLYFSENILDSASKCMCGDCFCSSKYTECCFCNCKTKNNSPYCEKHYPKTTLEELRVYSKHLMDEHEK
jgi:hypothetical protein